MDFHKRNFKTLTGASAVEFAILLPVLLLIVFGIIEFGLLIYNKHIITSASREGTRYGIIAQNPRVSDAEIDTLVQNYCNNRLVTFGAATNPTTTVTRTGLAFGDNLTVAVIYHYDFLLIPNFITTFTGGVDISAQTVMRME